jgi:hypothetical protein
VIVSNFDAAFRVVGVPDHEVALADRERLGTLHVAGRPVFASGMVIREADGEREDIPGMWVWRETLFAFLQRNAERSAAFFGVPAGQVVEFGTEIEI